MYTEENEFDYEDYGSDNNNKSIISFNFIWILRHFDV